MFGDVKDDVDDQIDNKKEPFDPDSNSAEPVSVLRDRASGRKDADKAAPSNGENSTN